MKIPSVQEINHLRQNARNVVRELGLLNDAYFDIGVTLAERHLLIELNSCLYPTIGEIAERLLLDKSTASRLIAKAVKKGYVQYSSDNQDKRKRFLQLSVKGKEVLDTFEPIAFNQTKEALLTLSEEEIELVYRGITLYAKGLKNSRLRNKTAVVPIDVQDNTSLVLLFAEESKNNQDCINLFETYQKKGCSYLVMKKEGRIIAGIGIAPCPKGTRAACHLEKISLRTDMRNLGLEKILIDSGISEAKRLGYKKCFFEPIPETHFSNQIFEELGFQFLNKNKQLSSLLWKAC